MPTITKDQISRPKISTFNSWDSIDQRVVDDLERQGADRRRGSTVSAIEMTKMKGKQRDPDIYGLPRVSPKPDHLRNLERAASTPPVPPIPVEYADFITQVNTRPTISRTSTMRERDLKELKLHLDAIDKDRQRDLESQVRIQTQQYRMGWRSILQIGSAFVSTATLTIAITNLVDRLRREAIMDHLDNM